MRILATSAAIRSAISELMSPGATRRVAIAAFVGDGARAFIRNPKGVEIICWPKAGGTNPLELSRLKKAGARIRFADRLHMKLYWAARRGAIITSANLSTNALGAGDLKEFGIFLPPDSFRINGVISSLKSRAFNAADMKKLELEHRKLKARKPQRHQSVDRVSYGEWFQLPARSEWKLGWWDSAGSVSKEAKEIAKTEFNSRTPYTFISCNRKEYKVNDWVLSFRLTKRGAAAPEWIYIDFIVRVRRRDKAAYFEDYPFQAVQVFTPRHYPPPPFAITKEFRTALHKTSRAFGVGRLTKLRSARVPKMLLKMLAKRMA
ncbi:MAG TPA: hypothetical protein VJN93_01085 [Candidatus Acidoferrum sp.]|nr:hypothetical protein [Candidatus Acidoferrum sp.]